jgi:hypothetical protein
MRKLVKRYAKITIDPKVISFTNKESRQLRSPLSVVTNSHYHSHSNQEKEGTPSKWRHTDQGRIPDVPNKCMLRAILLQSPIPLEGFPPSKAKKRAR